MLFGTVFLLAMVSVLVLAMEMRVQNMQKRIDYLLGQRPLPYGYKQYE
jgi:hypothetical protein